MNSAHVLVIGTDGVRLDLACGPCLTPGKAPSPLHHADVATHVHTALGITPDLTGPWTAPPSPREAEAQDTMSSGRFPILPPCLNTYMKCRTITFRSRSAQGVRLHRAAAVTAGARPPRIPHRIAFVEFHRRSLGRASSKEGRPVDEEWR